MCWMVALAVAGAAASAGAAIDSSQSQKAAAKYNEKISQDQATDALQTGATNAADERQRTRELISKQTAAQAAGNIDSASGSALDLTTDTAGMGELNALRMINNAQRGAAGYINTSKLENFKGKAAVRTGYFAAAGSLLSGATNMAKSSGVGSSGSGSSSGSGGGE